MVNPRTTPATKRLKFDSGESSAAAAASVATGPASSPAALPASSPAPAQDESDTAPLSETEPLDPDDDSRKFPTPRVITFTYITNQFNRNAGNQPTFQRQRKGHSGPQEKVINIVGHLHLINSLSCPP